MNSKIEGNTLGILRRSFFPFNALGMPSFNNSVHQSLVTFFLGTHFIYYITTNYYSIKENPAKTKTNRKTVNAMIQKSQTKTSSYVCTIIEKLSLAFAPYM